MTTVRDLVTDSLYEAGVVGQGQAPDAYMMNKSFSRLNFMISQWAQKRWVVYRLVTASWVATGAANFTIGPTGTVTNYTNPVSGGVDVPITFRPDRIEDAYIRNLNASTPNQPDTPLSLLESKEDYNRIGLKSLLAMSSYIFYDPTSPNGTVWPWPIPNSGLYQIFVSAKMPLNQFASLSETITLPAEYEGAILYNLAYRLRSLFGVPKPQGTDDLLGMARDGLAVVRGSNTAIARLKMPVPLSRRLLYNIYSDRNY